MSAMPAGWHTVDADELVERRAARPLRDQREHDEAAVAVGELLAGRELGREPVEHGEELLGRRELLHRHRHHVVAQLALLVLVEVVADPRPVGQELLDGHPVVDEREVGAEHRAGRCA